MKKLFAILLSVSMLAGMLSVSTVVTASTPSPLIDLNFSNYDTTTKTITNNGEYTGATISVSGTPTLDSVAVDGEHTPYLNMGATPGSNNGILVQDTSLFNRQAMTIETWTRKTDISQIGHMFLMNNGASPHNFAIEFSGSKLALTPSNSCSGYPTFKSGLIQSNVWTHVVFTRSYDATKSTLDFVLYIDGVAKQSGTSVATNYIAPTKLFISGGGYVNTVCYPGDYATVKVYGEALDSTTVKNIYDTSKPLFYSALEPLIDLDFSKLQTNGTVPNIGTCKSASVSITGSPTASSFSMNGNSTPYMNTGDTNYANKGVVVSDATEFDRKSLSIETWTRNSDISKNGFLFLMNNGASPHNIGAQFYESKLFLVPGNTNGARIYNGCIESNVWKHVVFTRTYNDDKTSYDFELYIDGVKKANETNVATTYTKPTNLYVSGGAYNNTVCYPGDFGKFRVYGIALSDTQIKNKYDSDKSKFLQMGSLLFDMDLSGYDQTGAAETSMGIKNSKTDSDTGITVATAPEKKIHSFGGYSTPYLSFGSETSTKGVKIDGLTNDVLQGKTITLETWARNTQVETEFSPHLFLLTDESDNHDLQLYWNQNQTAFKPYFGATAQTWDFSNHQNLNEWQHIVYTRSYNDDYSSCAYALYINGHKIKEATDAVAAYVTPDALHLGGGTYNQDFMFRGDIAELKIYDTALNATQILTEFNEEKSRYLDLNSLVFEMDLSEYNPQGTSGTAMGIKNAVTNSSSDISIVTAPVLENYQLDETHTTPYLALGAARFGREGLQINDSIGKLFDNQELTFETWTRNNDPTTSATSPHLFLLTNTGWAAHDIQLLYNSGKTYLKPYQGASVLDWAFTSYQKAAEWEHIVYTRSFNSTYTTCTYVLYVNGTKIREGTSAVSAYSTPGVLYLGGGAYKNSVKYAGDIATFKIYNRARTQEEIANDFVTTRKNFDMGTVELVSDVEFTFKNSEGGTLLDFSPSTTEAIVSYSLGNYSLWEQAVQNVLAVYDGNKLVKCTLIPVSMLKGETKPVSISLTGLTTQSDTKIKMFVWNDFFSCEPLLGSASVVSCVP